MSSLRLKLGWWLNLPRRVRWREPTLKELLSEPIITALMDADGVDPEELEALLRAKFQYFEATLQ